MVLLSAQMSAMFNNGNKLLTQHHDLNMMSD